MDRLNGQKERDGSAAPGTDAVGAAGAADGVAEVAGGTFSGGVVNPAAGVFSNGTDGPTAVVPCLPVSVPVGALAAGGRLSALPRMIGRPSLPLPMMTVFAFVDCES